MTTLHWLRDPRELSTSLAALEMIEAAGSCLAPSIPDGAQLFVDPQLEPRHGDFVLLSFPAGIEGTDINETVKQFQIHTEPSGRQVKLICNSAGRFRLVDEQVLGVVVALAATPGRKSEQGHLVDAAHAKMIERIRGRMEMRG